MSNRGFNIDRRELDTPPVTTGGATAVIALLQDSEERLSTLGNRLNSRQRENKQPRTSILGVDSPADCRTNNEEAFGLWSLP
jgi:hypothetical protein